MVNRNIAGAQVGAGEAAKEAVKADATTKSKETAGKSPEKTTAKAGQTAKSGATVGATMNATNAPGGTTTAKFGGGKGNLSKREVE
jgi:hypothetical protein